MPRSYLFQGSDVEHLSPYQRQLERLYDQVDRPGYRIAPQQFFQSQDYLNFINQQYGAIPVPPGARVMSQSPTEVRYLDAEGFEHILRRDVAGGREGGQITEQTNRPPVLPNQAAAPFLDVLQRRLQQGVTAPASPFGDIPPEIAARLAEISAAEVAANDQAAQQLQGELVARLYGSGVQRSSIANQAAADFAQRAGLVRQQQRGDAANRELALRQFVTELNQRQQQAQTDTAAGLFTNLTGQGTQRDIASAGLGLDLKKLEESTRQFNAANVLEGLRVQLGQEQLDAANSPFQKFLQTVSAAGSLASGVGTGLGAYKALTGGK